VLRRHTKIESCTWSATYVSFSFSGGISGYRIRSEWGRSCCYADVFSIAGDERTESGTMCSQKAESTAELDWRSLPSLRPPPFKNPFINMSNKVSRWEDRRRSAEKPRQAPKARRGRPSPAIAQQIISPQADSINTSGHCALPRLTEPQPAQI
jgi:hypothetical protein